MFSDVCIFRLSVPGGEKQQTTEDKALNGPQQGDRLEESGEEMPRWASGYEEWLKYL
jgi:hypothetical protein